MATNNILGFCTGANPNVLTPTAWQTTPARSSGFVSGIARSSHVNTAVVGGANIAHAVGEFIKNQLNEDVNPTDETTLVSQFLRSLQVFIQRGGACPVGSIIPYLGGDVPYGWLLANGASVLRKQYDKLFALIGTKSAPLTQHISICLIFITALSKEPQRLAKWEATLLLGYRILRVSYSTFMAEHGSEETALFLT